MQMIIYAFSFMLFCTEVLARTPPLSGCQSACSRLAHILGTAVKSPGNGNLTVWDAKQQAVHSACRVMLLTTDEVAEALSIILEHSCRFSVKSGGHARYPDDSISVGGVTIDLQRMRSLELSTDRSTVKLGAGHVLYSMYHGLENYNLTSLGGRTADVGLGGYTLGGGLSSLAPKYGLAMDNVFEYELVLPNATVVKVNHEEQPDLYFVLRGGMNNFGIVTHFTSRAVPQGKILSGSKTYAFDKRDALIEQAYQLTTTWSNDTNMAFWYDMGYDQRSGNYTLAFNRAYTAPERHPLPFRALDRIPSTSSTVRIDWQSNFSLEVAEATPPGLRHLYATLSYVPSRDLDKQLQDIMITELQAVKNVPGFYPNLVIQPLFEGAIRAGKERGGNAAGIEAEGPLSIALFTVSWSNADDDDVMAAFADRWADSAKAATRMVGKSHPWLYINYASNHQDPFSGYQDANVQRLRSIQRAVDAKGIFTSRGFCRGYFKLD